MTVLDSLELTPSMRSVLQGMARAARPPLHHLAPAQARAAYEAGAGVLELPRAPMAQVQHLHIPARDGALLPARLYAPSGAAGLPLLLYLHGGGFTVGSLDTHEVLCRELARLAGCLVLALDYRLAPEHRFPTAHDDAWDALQWLALHAPALGADPARLAVGGDSAGGTLSAYCALMARDAGLPLALQLLFYPGTTPYQDTAAHARYGQGLILEAAGIDWFFDNYLPTRAQREDWRFAPLLAAEHEGLAPAWIGLAECDPLADDGILYADCLRAARVPVALEIYRGVTHEFIKMGRVLPEARQAHADAAQALRQAFGLSLEQAQRATHGAVDGPMPELHLGDWAQLGADATQLRMAVFVQEQGIAPELEIDALDAQCLHAVAYKTDNRQNTPVATGRLLPADADGCSRIGRMAVDHALRGRNYGRLVLDALLRAARARGDRSVLLHAQCSAEGFYRRAGFVPEGERFDEVEIPHIAMRLRW